MKKTILYFLLVFVSLSCFAAVITISQKECIPSFSPEIRSCINEVTTADTNDSQKKSKKVTFYGDIRENLSGEKISATLIIRNKSNTSDQGAYVLTDIGQYKIALSANNTYEITIKSLGYRKIIKTFSVSENMDRKQRMDYFLDIIEAGRTVKLNNILFEKDTKNLIPESFGELNRLYEFMKINTGITIEISGHTSSEGESDLNLSLSQARANVIVEYLISKGINQSRMIAVGYGETRPVASNQTEEGRSLNRRVEFTILKSE